ncbi:hypothetical protein [Pseudoxanthomonas wuyuanensis]|uniref:Uncharacterized protein n=1 Tax=Pseudoxanthomonas wuyuanensis TaxID=1073196 RepID=A0A286CXP7_9GAMM|nr:hypothetical protein [Pseudoxanthomonas wuyuanensis]KAF1722617.1 hypothetical protein CSC75_01985 [Pseudoxanthomonas wuyuanensis]SOD51176.1 hypothetical protein SAMN06296416_101491 [Pseudoxanthomonas wuyuanensis]
MNHKLTYPLSVTGAGLALLAMGLLNGGARPGLLPDAGMDDPLSGALKAELLTPESETAGKPKPRRARASLSMPYFSFAQSLRPRS